jgi:hypothetical protein
MGRKHHLRALLAGASLGLAVIPAHAAPPIAYPLVSSNGNQDLYLVNPDGSGKVLLYSAGKVGIGMLDMNAAANQLAIVETGFKGFKIINYSSAGVRQSINPVSDTCTISGIDFHPTDGSLLVGEYCSSEDMLQIRRWTSAGFDAAPMVTFGSGQNQAIGHVRWLGDGSGFLVNYLYSDGTTLHRRIDRYMMGTLGAPVTVTSVPPSANADFDTARCGGTTTGPCWALAYDDGTGHIHRLHFDSMGAMEDSVQTGSTPHFSPSNSQLLYRLQSRPNFLLKVDDFSLVAKGNVGPGIDWRPQ